MSNTNTAFKASVLALTLLGASSASASAMFTFTTDFGTSEAVNVISSNVDAKSTYSAAGLPGATSVDQLIGRNDVTVTDVSTNGQINSWLNGTSPIGGGAGVIGTDYRIFFNYTLSGTAQIIDGGNNSLFQDGTLDANGDGLIDSGLISSTTTSSGFAGLDGISPTYTSGTIELVYENLISGDVTKLLELSLIDMQVDGANVILNAGVDYSWYTGGSSLVENFFNFVTPVGGQTSFYDIWTSGLSEPSIQIVTRSDFNVDPNYVPTSNGDGTFSRETNLNVTTVVDTVNIPEPASLALLGLGLTGLGFASRRRNKKA